MYKRIDNTSATKLLCIPTADDGLIIVMKPRK